MLARLVASPIGPYLAAGAVLAAFAAGWSVRDWRCDAAAARGLEKALEGLQTENRRLTDISAGLEQELRADDNRAYESRSRVRTIYRDRSVRPDCDVDPASLRVLDNAWRNANGRTTGEPVVPLPSVTTDP